MPVVEKKRISNNSELLFRNNDRRELVDSAYNVSDTEPFRYNKIILGSKPSNVLQKNATCYREKGLYSATVKLKNIKTYLDGCKKYCQICFILFPSKEALNIHMQHLHCISTTNELNLNESSDNPTKGSKKLIEIKPKCTICHKYFASRSSLNKHKRNIHFIRSRIVKRRKIIKTNNVASKLINRSSVDKRPSNDAKSCFHCNSIFPNMQLLIEHLYDTLQMKKGTKHNIQTTQSIKLSLSKEKVIDDTVNLEKNKVERTVQKISCVSSLRTLFYRCPFCSYYFKNEKFSFRHLQNKHKFFKKASLKKVLFEPKCKFCFSEFKDVQGYNAHISKVHKKILTRTSVAKYSSSKPLKPTVKNCKISKIDTCNLPIETKTMPKDTDDDVHINKRIIKSALFKCIRCDIHFLHSHVAIDHTNHMEILINWKCSLCNRIFKKNDEHIHRQQHLATNDFVVYVIGESTTILYNCLKCGVHFDENNYLQHYPDCKKVPINHVKCDLCGIFIDCNIYHKHKDYHRIKDNKTLDLIVVQTEVFLNNEIGKTSSNVSQESKELRIKNIPHDICTQEIQSQKFITDPMFKVYYCNTCKCFINYTKLIYHKKSLCTNVVPATCKHCGLIITQTSISSHGRLHQKKRDLTLQDLQFYDLKNLRISPPIPDFPHCSICEIYFVNVKTRLRHECGIEDFIKCIDCDKKYSELAYKLHMGYHNYRLGGYKTLRKQYRSPIVSKCNTSKNENVLTITSKSNFKGGDGVIIFTCKNCHISLDNYDLVVEHCQGHYNPVKDLLPTKICKGCGLIFSAKCFESHKKMHTKKNVSFTFVNFDISYFTSDYNVWIKRVFCSLPQELNKNIMNKSVYKYENRIKMKVIQDSSEGLTVYKCDKCQCFIDPTSLYKHLGNHCLKLRKHTCRMCEMPFISLTSKVEHETVHLKPFKGLKSYRIVLFNREEDKTFNESLSSGNFFTLYKCRRCDGIVSKEDNKNHLCDRRDLKKCSFCGLLLYSKDFNLHVSKHNDFDCFNEENIKLILTGKPPDNDVDRRMIVENYLTSSFKGKVHDYLYYKCKNCDICFNDAKSIPKHDCSFEIPKLKCSKCEYIFEARKLKNHHVQHETDCHFVAENITIIDFDCTPLPKLDSCRESTPKIVVQKKAKLYKCPCGLHFLNPYFTTHLNVCGVNNRISRQQCSKCGLAFRPNVLFKHLLTHHGNKNVSYTFDIIDTKDKKKSSLTSE